MSILVICAHSDDQIFGPGGTIAKFAKEGKKIYTIIMSYGEMSHPWLKRQYSAPMRVKESKKADKIIGGEEVIFLGLKEGKLYSEFKEKKLKKKLGARIKKIKPSIVFTHSNDDPLPDHRDTNKIARDILNSIKYKKDIYAFDVWNLWNLKKRYQPRLYIDISKTFHLKIKALKVFKSQKLAMILLLWSVYTKGLINGMKIKTKWAERFYKIQ